MPIGDGPGGGEGYPGGMEGSSGGAEGNPGGMEGNPGGLEGGSIPLPTDPGGIGSSTDGTGDTPLPPPTPESEGTGNNSDGTGGLDAQAPNLPSDFENLPMEMKFEIFKTLSLRELANVRLLSGADKVAVDAYVKDYAKHVIQKSRNDPDSLSQLAAFRPVGKSAVDAYINTLVADGQLVYPLSNAPVRGTTFPGNDDQNPDPVHFDTDPEGTLSLWKTGWIIRAPAQS